MTKRYDDALAPAGINVTQFSQLHVIARLKSPTIGQLARETHLDRSTLGRNLRVLMRMNLAQFDSGKDERTRVISITKDGRGALKVAKPLWQAVQDSLAEKLGEKQHQALLGLLDELEATAP